MFKRLGDILQDKTAHGDGDKYVFLEKEEALSNLTQVAVGFLTNRDCIEMHAHPTMEEYYYFLEGKASFIIGDDTFKCNPNTFVQVPHDVNHQLSTTNLVKFLYWGIAIK